MDELIAGYAGFGGRYVLFTNIVKASLLPVLLWSLLPHISYMRVLLQCKTNSMTLLSQNRANRITFFLLLSAFLCIRVSYADNVKPFWTEKSSYIEGNNLYVIGIASNASSVEAGRMRAFENGKSEIMNFTQISDLEGLAIKTQMTYEEERNNKYTIYRLMYVDYECINSLKNKKIEQTKKNYQRLQQKQEQEIKIREDALSRLNENKKELASLDKEYRRIVSNVHIASEKAMRYVKVGMSRLEVESLLGSPRSMYKHYDEYVYDTKYGDYWVIFDSADAVKCLSTGKKCVCLLYTSPSPRDL